MYNNLYLKEAIIINCLDALAPVRALDGTHEEIKAALLDAFQVIETYPNIKGLKRTVLQAGTTDCYAVSAYKNLSLCVSGEGTTLIVKQVFAALGEALQLLQTEINSLAS